MLILPPYISHHVPTASFLCIPFQSQNETQNNPHHYHHFTDREIEEGGVISPQLPTRPKAGLGTESITLHYLCTGQSIRDCDTCHPNI